MCKCASFSTYINSLDGHIVHGRGSDKERAHGVAAVYRVEAGSRSATMTRRTVSGREGCRGQSPYPTTGGDER